MPAVSVSYTREQAAVLQFDGEPFAVVAQTGVSEWSIYDVRQWSEESRGFVGRLACGVSASREHGIRVAYAHIG